MNKVSSYKIKVLGASVAIVFLFSYIEVFAVTPDRADSNPQRESIVTRLQDAKFEACQARENNIKNRSIKLADLAKNMQDKFNAIAKRVQDYYANTVVPSGKTVTNYDALVADMQVKKTAVQTAITNAQNNFSSFSCDSDDPKGTMTQFRKDMQSVKQSLKNYRTSIKNLIVAVRSITDN